MTEQCRASPDHPPNILLDPSLVLPKTTGQPADMSKPVKIFILMGQSNMLGFGQVKGDGGEGSLEYAVRHKKRFPHLLEDANTNTWATRQDVRNVRVMQENNNASMVVHQNEWLTIKDNLSRKKDKIGPEVQIGWILGSAFDDPVLVLKSCIGNRSLGWDLLPPGSVRVEANGDIYAGYKDSPQRWKVGTTEPEPINWYAGKQYDIDTANAKAVLSNLAEYYPGATAGYEIAGFFFWQGHKDSGDGVYAGQYEKNLVQFIKSLRTDFEAPDAPFVCATVGFQGRDMKGGMLQVWQAQMAVDGTTGNYPEFEGNVRTVDIRDSWRNVGKAGHHYGLHAETYMEVGNAMGWAMAELLSKSGTCQLSGVYSTEAIENMCRATVNGGVNFDQYYQKLLPKEEIVVEPMTVKVFILMGEQSMVGLGKVKGDEEGSLEYAVHHKKLYTHLVREKVRRWKIRQGVWNVQVRKQKGRLVAQPNGWLTVQGNQFGPELEIGWMMGHPLLGEDEPILLLKSCAGGSLGWELLPPGSQRFELGSQIYAGYKDASKKWKKEREPNPSGGENYAGNHYDQAIANAKMVLSNLGDYYPGATDYEIAGFFFWQGHGDATGQKNPTEVYVSRYEQNLAQFIRSVRNDFDAPNAPFVCATVGCEGRNMSGSTLQVWEAQMAVGGGGSGKYPEFEGNVKTVDIRDSWRAGGAKPDFRYGQHAETYMEVGNAMGWAMTELLLNAHTFECPSKIERCYDTVSTVEKQCQVVNNLRSLDSDLKHTEKTCPAKPDDEKIATTPVPEKDLKLNLDTSNSSSVPIGQPADMSKPVKVFVLMGQSNMLGFGQVKGNGEGSLEYAVHHKKRFPHLLDETGKWATRKDVRNVRVMYENGRMKVYQNEWLTVKGTRLGPEVEIGWILGSMLDDEPVLLLKSCIGNRSLGWDLLPPGSERFEANGEIYAGYKDCNAKWKVGTEPEPVNWYGGKQYDDDTANVKAVLENLGDYYPGASNYEIAGFFFWQGHKDTLDKVHALHYEKNLVRFIKCLRTDFDAPDAPFVCATVGFNGRNMKGNTLQVWKAQMGVDGDSGKYPEFQGNVRTVDIRDSWRNGRKAGHHYGLHAETYMEVGNAMGLAMTSLLLGKKGEKA